MYNIRVAKTLIIYSTVDGHTRLICERIQKTLQNHKQQVNIVNLDDINTITLDDFNNIIIGASIRYGKHRAQLYDFINNNNTILDSNANGFFSVNVVARKDDKNSVKTNPYMQKFLQLSAWKPQELAVFAGKIEYPKYKFFDLMMIKFIMHITKGPTNTKKTYEFTDWDKVDAFTQRFIK